MYTKLCNVSQQIINQHSIQGFVTKEEYDLSQAWGLSTSIDLHDCDPDLMKDKKAIKEYTATLCKLIDATAWGPCQLHNFGTNPEVAGYSMVQLIETSLLSAHFANKTNRIFLDVFSCKYYDPQVAVEYSQKFFKAKDVTYKCTLRK